MAAVLKASFEEWNPLVHGERRSGVQRRRDVHVSLEDPYRTDDRRFGLGRRWEDWCRPAQNSAGAQQDVLRNAARR